MIQLTQEQPADLPAIEALLDESFGLDRRRKASYRFRRGAVPIAALSRVARDGDAVIGSIRFWPIAIGSARHGALLLGPLAVRSDHRSSGIGSRLMESTLASAAAAGHQRVLLVGDLAYYHRFGFAPAAGWGIAMPGERRERLLLKPLVDGAFDRIDGDIAAAGARPRRRASRPAASHATGLLPILPQPA
jgi:predicted N-acetyltransferase YhbS